MILGERVDTLLSNEDACLCLYDDFIYLKSLYKEQYDADFDNLYINYKDMVMKNVNNAVRDSIEETFTNSFFTYGIEYIKNNISEKTRQNLFYNMIAEKDLVRNTNDDYYCTYINYRLLLYVYHEWCESTTIKADDVYFEQLIDCPARDLLLNIIINEADKNESNEVNIHSVFYPINDGMDIKECRVKKKGEALLYKFYRAYKKSDIISLYKINMALSELYPEKSLLFESMISFCEGDYTEVIRLISDKVNNNTETSLSKKLYAKALAYLGNINGIVSFLKSSVTSFSEDYSCYLLQLAVKNSTEGYWDLSDVINPIISNGYLANKMSIQAKIDGLDVIEKIHNIGYETKNRNDLNPDMFSEEIKELKKCNNIIWIKEGTKEFFSESASSYIKQIMEGQDFGDIKEQVVEEISNLCFDNKHLSNGDSTFALESLYKIGAYDKYLEFVILFYDELRYIISSRNEFADAAINILINAYQIILFKSEESAALYAPIKEYVENTICYDNNGIFTDYEHRKITESMKKILSPRCYEAFVAAEWQYQHSIKEEYGKIDAGMIALGFSRIIELYLNEKVYSRVKKELYSYYHSFDRLEIDKIGKEIIKNEYYKGWSNLIPEEEDLNKIGDGLMLGPLLILFEKIGSRNRRKDKIADKFRELIIANCLTEEGIKDICGEYMMESIISSDNRNKYRNPPAHCEYLPHNIAKECRYFVWEAFEKFDRWFK